MPDAPRLLVCGVPRSGTTLLAEQLSRHPQLWVSPETHFYSLASTPVTRALRAHDAARVRAVLRRLPTQWRVQLDQTRFDAALDAISDAELLALRTPTELLFRLLAGLAPDGTTVLGEKTPAHLEWAFQALHDDPDLRVVVIVRDPRDIWRSLKGVSWSKAPPLPIGERWRMYGAEARHLARTHPDRVRIVRYEDFLVTSEAWTRDAWTWLGLEPVAGDVPVTSGPVTFDVSVEPWKQGSNEAPDLSRAYRWQREPALPGEGVLEQACGPELARYHYPPPRARAEFRWWEVPRGPVITVARRAERRVRAYRARTPLDRFLPSR